MHKRAAALCCTLVLTACSGGTISVNSPFPAGNDGKLKDEKAPSPEEDPKAPGMIPLECEALLNKSRDWGVVPGGGDWKPKTPEMAQEAVAFFSAFHLVPESTSEYVRVWMREHQPDSAAQARRSLDKADHAQSCDLLLAHKLLQSLLDYHWPSASRAAAGKAFHLFVLNQQTRVEPSMARAIQLDVMAKAVKKGFFKANQNALRKLQQWFDKETANGLARAEATADPLEQWKLSHDELRKSEEARERLSRILPLP